MKKLLLLILLLLTLPSAAYIEKNLTKLTMQNGMPDNMVYGIARDKDGFMWFASENGISRYDGTTLKNYTLPCKEQIANNIKCNQSNLVWVYGTYGNLFCLDRQTDSFIPIKGYKPKANREILKIHIANDSTVYEISDRTIRKWSLRFDHTERHIVAWVEKQADPLSDIDDMLMSITTDAKGTIYMTTKKWELLIMNPRTMKFESRQMDVKQTSTKNNTISSISVIGSSVWLASIGQGVIRYSLGDGTTLQLSGTKNKDGMNISHDGAYKIVKLNSNEYLVATWNGYGVLIFDEKDEKLVGVKNYSNSYSDIHRSNESRFVSAYIDKDNVLYLGTYGAGVFISDLREQFYNQYHQDQSNEIMVFALDRENHVWISTYHKGLLRSTEPFGMESKLNFKSAYNNILNNTRQRSLTIASDREGVVWGGTEDMQLYSFDTNGNKTQHNIEVDGHPQFNGSIQSIYCSASNQMWIGTDKGLLGYNPTTSRATPYLMANIGVNSITSDHLGNICMGTSQGVLVLNLRTGKVRCYSSHANILSLVASNDGNIYATCANGFIVVSNYLTHSSYKLYTTRDGLCNNYLTCIVEGPNGTIWVGSNSGISHFSRHQKVFHNFYIQGNNRAAICTDSVLLWGNNKSITYFYANYHNKFYEQLQKQKVKITGVEISGDMADVGENINGQVVLDKPIFYKDKIRLNSSNNNFSLFVSNLLFSTRHQRYQYRLLPIQQNWLTTDNKERISFTTVPPGNYTFQVRGLTAAERECPITELRIEVENHWMYSWWLKAILTILLISSFIYIFIRYRAKYKRRLYIAKLRAQITANQNELERERRGNEERVNFFNYASHELRTPLTLMLSPLSEVLSSETLDHHARQRLSIVERNANSLLELTTKLLCIQKMDANMVELHIHKTDVSDMMNKIAEEFSILASAHGIDFSFKNLAIEKDTWGWVDIDQLGQAIRNLISNGLKYTNPKGGVVEVTLDVQQILQTEHIVISVRDNGQGIHPSRQQAVFESFTTQNSKPLFSSKIGMGLFITRRIVEMHHGRVELQSQQGQGAIFTIYLPKINSIEQHKIESNTSPAPKVEGAEQTLLVVEDNIEMLNYISSLFDSSYRVLKASSGEEGLSLAREQQPHCILHDMMLPSIGGIECLKSLSSEPETMHIPVIMLSAVTDESQIVEGIKLGAADYVTKPFNPRILKAKVETQIRLRQTMGQVYNKSLALNEEPETEDQFVQKLINIIQANLTNEQFSVEMLSDMLNMSVSTLRRTAKLHTPLSLKEIIRNVRLTKAASLLMERDARINEVSEMVGYNDISTFRAHFTKKFGVAPSKFNSESNR